MHAPTHPLPAPYTTDGHYHYPVRIYYEDTDTAGVVYYANYLKFAERARSEWLRSLGIEQAALLATHGLGFVVAKAHIAYKKPARLDDILWIDSHLQHIAKARMSMRQILRVDSVIAAELSVELACVNSEFRPQRLPESLHQLLSASG